MKSFKQYLKLKESLPPPLETSPKPVRIMPPMPPSLIRRPNRIPINVPPEEEQNDDIFELPPGFDPFENELELRWWKDPEVMRDRRGFPIA